jgi:transcriptional regulator with XRE-family HTH domain
MARDIDRYDATALVGLNVVLINGAKEVVEIEDDKEVPYVQVPNLEELSAAAALLRCMMPQKLRGPEIRALRKIAGMTARELSEAMGGKPALETISRWENGAEFAGGYAESVLRLAICEHVKDRAPGIDYSADKLNRVKMIGNGKLDSKSVAPVVMRRMLVRHDHRTNDSWTAEREAA